MNNRLYLIIIACASINLGVLIYGWFFSEPRMDTAGAIGMLMITVFLYSIAFGRKTVPPRQPDNHNNPRQ